MGNRGTKLLRYGTRPLYVIVLAGVISAFAPSARAACTMPSGSYAGVKAGGDYFNATGIDGFTNQMLYGATSMTITEFPTTSLTGKFKWVAKLSLSPPTSPQNSIVNAAGTISKITGYDATTCSGNITTYAAAAVTPINCTAGPSCALGAQTVIQLAPTFRFTSSQGGAHVTLAPISIDPIAPGTYFDLWRQ